MDKQSPASGAAKRPAAVPEDAGNLLASEPPAASSEKTEPPTSQPTELQGTQAYMPGQAPAGSTQGNDPPPLQRTLATTQTPAPSQPDKTQPPGSASAAREQKTNTLGDFRLLKKLGEGGMGTVYKAHQISLDREVAVKVLSKHLAAKPDFVERFLREARLMAKLDHPNILRCFGVGQEHGFHYFAMEYIDGGSMQGWLAKVKQLSVGDALHVLLACARGLQHAHEQNMIHRDIKPDNILLTHKGVIKVADLGLAKAHGEELSLTRTGTAAGTPIYMSPEQARDAKHVDHRSDIYSLGCMLYTFIAGKPPFEGETYVELFEAKEKGKFSSLRKLNPDVPDRLDLIVDKMLSQKPELRHQSCADLIKDLEGLGLAGATLTFLENEAILAAKAAAAATARTEPAPSGLGTRKSPTRPGAAPGPTQFREEAEVEDPNYWYVSYQTSDGRLVNRKMTTAQLREIIKDPHFDAKAQASHNKNSGYRSLASYSEFAQVLQGRIAKARADRKAAKFHNIYEKLEAEERKRQRWRWFSNLFRSGVGWLMFLFYLAVLAGAGYVVYLLIRWGIHWLGTKMETLTNVIWLWMAS